MSNYGSYSGGSKTARNAWIITAVIAVVAIIAVAVVIIIANTNAPAPSPTDKRTIQPTNSPTGTSTSTPTVTPTPSPTSTATPTPTASPSASGSTTPKPNPTTPSPTPTIDPAIAWATSLYGTFSPLTASGQGNSHVAVPKGVKGALLTVTNNGGDDQDFRVEVYNQFGKPMSTLVDVQGDYQGTVAYGLNSQIGATPTTILITSSGNWSVEFAPISTASTELGSGTSNDVILCPGDAGPLAVQSLTSGDFSLTTFSGKNPTANVLTTQSGWWNGTVDLPDGPLVLVVSSNGAWNLKFGFVTQ